MSCPQRSAGQAPLNLVVVADLLLPKFQIAKKSKLNFNSGDSGNCPVLEPVFLFLTE
jgi:hypothetical protein